MSEDEHGAQELSGRGRWQFALVVFVLASAFVVWAFVTDDSDDGSSSGYAEHQPEYQLAVIDGGGTSDSDIAPYDRALSRADTLCNENRRTIADMTVHTTQNEVRGETNLSMLRALTQSIPEEAAPRSCSEAYAALITIMRGS